MNVKFIGGSLCLDFVNTVGARVGNQAYKILRDKLATYENLLAWSRLAGLVSPSTARLLARGAATDTVGAAATLARAITLREALYRIFKSIVDGRRTAGGDIDTLSRELSIARAHERLSRSAGIFVWTWDDRFALDRVIWDVSKSAADLLTSGELSKLRQCGGDECGWIFLDTSRNRGRLWCEMRVCGNRAKVRRFRARERR